MKSEVRLQASQVHQTAAIFTKINFFVYTISLLFSLYYRFSTFSQSSVFPWFLVTMSELQLSFFWICAQAFRWRPVSRTVYPDRLPSNEDLPSIDVFVFTCDPKMEPTIRVMSTVISAMYLDYPTEKLSIYLSDDGGARITLYAAKEAYKFAKQWISFCKKHGIKTIAPEAFFSKSNNDQSSQLLSQEFSESLREIKTRYRMFKKRMETAIDSDENCLDCSTDRASVVEFIGDNKMIELDHDGSKLPLFVYVSREKRPDYHHHFKAGAINVLLRVSTVISNAPYLLFLDCDMYCNDPMSARQAMCFHLDPQLKQSLAFVQFPQTFHNLSKNDIYNPHMRAVFKIWFHGLDGLMGPILSGTCFYLKREALYRSSPRDSNISQFQAKERFGASDKLIAAICNNQSLRTIDSEEETRILASCTYEEHTQWGKQVGFRYQSVVEDVLTGMFLHSKGWISAYHEPSTPAFHGSGLTNLNNAFTQNIRWSSGLLQIGMLKFCPIYRPCQMSILQRIGYLVILQPLDFFTAICHSVIPQLCLLNGVTLYPKVSDHWFVAFAIFHLSPPLQQVLEAFMTGGSFKLFWNDQKLWLMRATSNLLAFLDILKKMIGMKEIEFTLTNKSTKEKAIESYQNGVYDFNIDGRLQHLLTTIASLNVTSFALGLRRAIMNGNYDELLGQIFLSLVIVVLSFPVLEAMLVRKDEGRIPTATTLLSISIVFVGYHIGLLIL